MILNNLKRILNELGLNIPINEMAIVGNVDNYTIIVESNDHDPPHFHFKLNNKTVSRIEIPEYYIDKTYELRYLKNQTRLSSRLERMLIDWFREYYPRNKKITNLEFLQMQWNSLHANNIKDWDLN